VAAANEPPPCFGQQPRDSPGSGEGIPSLVNRPARFRLVGAAAALGSTTWPFSASEGSCRGTTVTTFASFPCFPFVPRFATTLPRQNPRAEGSPENYPASVRPASLVASSSAYVHHAPEGGAGQTGKLASPLGGRLATPPSLVCLIELCMANERRASIGKEGQSAICGSLPIENG